MSAFDLVLLLIIANAVQNAIVGPEPMASCSSTAACAGEYPGDPVLLEHPRRAEVPQVCSGRCASKASPPPAEVPTLYAPRPTSLNS